jgi:hypothetical protein
MKCRYERLKENYESRNNINHSADTRPDRSVAHLGLQYIVGICARRHCRVAVGDCDYPRAVGEIVTYRENEELENGTA